MISMVLTLGAPVMDAQGNILASTSSGEAAVRATTVDVI